MKLPNPEKAHVGREKIVDYVLNAEHPDNGGKAEFFERLGFRRDEWKSLAAVFQRLAKKAEILQGIKSAHGTKYVNVGRIERPAGRAAAVQTVWILDSGADAA